MSGCMGTGKKVQILLSTYNGDKYLREQLNSFLQLDYFNECKVLIRDDGSTDKTRTILQEYEKHEQFQIFYGDNIGITDSYLWLMEHSDPNCLYFSPSDQDDVWLPNKVSLALSVLDGQDNSKPLLLGTLSHIVDSSMKPIMDLPVPKRPTSYYNAMIQNVLPGHTQVMNRAMLDLILQHGVRDVHVIDWWFYLVGAAMGKVILLPEYTVLHRIHDANAVGVSRGFLESLAGRISYIRAGRGNAFSKQLDAFYQIFGTELPDEYRAETEKFLGAQSNIVSRLHYVLSCKAYRQSIREDLAFRCLYLMGKYKL